MNYLELVNSVLVRTREGTVSSVNETDYSQLIGEFVKQALGEVQAAWDWTALRRTIQIVTQDGTWAYSLTGAGQAYHVLQVFEDTQDYELFKPETYQQMNAWLLQNSPAVEAPQYWDTNGLDDEDDPIINLYPIPDQPYVLNFNVKIDGKLTEDTDRIAVPTLPVILRAAQLAFEERGDAGGSSGASLAVQADSALSSAIGYDAVMYNAETIWVEE